MCKWRQTVYHINVISRDGRMHEWTSIVSWHAPADWRERVPDVCIYIGVREVSNKIIDLYPEL
jgi:hypothetical protein